MLDRPLPGQATGGRRRFVPTTSSGRWTPWLALLTVMTAVLASPAPAAAQQAPSKTGFTLELWCMSDQQDDKLACWHYLVGVGDGLTAARAFGNSTLCVDTARPMPPEQLRQAFLNWAAAHPEARERPAANDAVAALVAAYPCSK